MQIQPNEEVLNTVDRADTRCRLCGQRTTPAFQKMLMYKYPVQYFECSACGCLQTEAPYWLDEAYRDDRRFTDTFCGVRAVRNQVLTYYLFRILRLPLTGKVVDWGGGDGLTTRVLRDAGLDAYSFDRYARNSYALGFDGALEPGLAMITSFEVWEHLSDPGKELDELFACAPESLFISTGIYRKQDKRWPYLGAYSGRHIFFYSPRGMEWLARKYDYDLHMAGDYVVFSRTALSARQRRAIRILMDRRLLRFFHAWLALRPPAGRASDDFAKMRRLLNDDDVEPR